MVLGATDTIKIILTAKDNGNAKRPHQAFLVLKDEDSGLEAPFPLTVKDTGKAVGQIVSYSLSTTDSYATQLILPSNRPRRTSRSSSSKPPSP